MNLSAFPTAHIRRPRPLLPTRCTQSFSSLVPYQPAQLPRPNYPWLSVPDEPVEPLQPTEQPEVQMPISDYTRLRRKKLEAELKALEAQVIALKKRSESITEELGILEDIVEKRVIGVSVGNGGGEGMHDSPDPSREPATRPPANTSIEPNAKKRKLTRVTQTEREFESCSEAVKNEEGG